MTARGFLAGTVRLVLVAWVVATLTPLVAIGAGTVADRQVTMVNTASMLPLVAPDDLVMLAPVVTNEVAVGQILAYRPPEQQSRVVLHRVVDVIERPDGRFFVMKGDANTVVDPRPVADDHVTGQLVGHVPRIGILLRLAGEPGWRVALVVVPLALAVLLRLLDPPARRDISGDTAPRPETA